MSNKAAGVAAPVIARGGESGVPGSDGEPPANCTVIEVRDVRVDYRLGSETTTVLSLPEWRVAAHDQIAIFGPSGSGKSTLLHVLAGVITPTTGSVRICGEEITAMSEAQRDGYRARQVGYVFQNLNLLPGYTARENVLLGATFGSAAGSVGSKSLRQAADALLISMGLAHRLGHTPSQMSLGEQQRVAMARALIKRPSLVPADEPTGSLDPRNTAQVVRLLRTACAEQGSTLIVVSHDPAVIREFEHNVAFRDLNRAWDDSDVHRDEVEAGIAGGEA